MSLDASSDSSISSSVRILVAVQGLLVLLEQGDASDLFLTIHVLVEQQGGRFGVLSGVDIGTVQVLRLDLVRVLIHGHGVVIGELSCTFLGLLWREACPQAGLKCSNPRYLHRPIITLLILLGVLTGATFLLTMVPLHQAVGLATLTRYLPHVHRLLRVFLLARLLLVGSFFLGFEEGRLLGRDDPTFRVVTRTKVVTLVDLDACHIVELHHFHYFLRDHRQASYDGLWLRLFLITDR